MGLSTIWNPALAPPRRFPPPWTVREVAEAYCVYDAADRALAYVYFDTADRGTNTERMTRTRRAALPRVFPSCRR